MRRHTMETLAENGFAVKMRDVGEAEFYQSDEVFLTNSQFGILPVRRCGEKVWQQHPITRDVMAMMAKKGVAECAL